MFIRRRVVPKLIEFTFSSSIFPSIRVFLFNILKIIKIESFLVFKAKTNPQKLLNYLPHKLRISQFIKKLF